MKTVLFAIILVNISAQSKPQGVFSNATNTALEKVIQDYPNQFKNIRGAMLIEDGQATNYESSIQIPGAVSCIVSQSNTSRKTSTWKAELFASTNFSEASNKYDELYSQIKNTIIKIQGNKPYILHGQYSAPTRGKQYQYVILNLLPASGDLQNVKVEISLENNDGIWKLQLSIYDDRNEQLVRRT